jgi:hypothetical protein
MLSLGASRARRVVGAEDTDRVPGPGSAHLVEARQAAFSNSHTTRAGLAAASRGIAAVRIFKGTITMVAKVFSRIYRTAVSNSRTIRPGSRVILNS